MREVVAAPEWQDIITIAPVVGDGWRVARTRTNTNGECARTAYAETLPDYDSAAEMYDLIRDSSVRAAYMAYRDQPSANPLDTILALAAKLPSGVNDPAAARKLVREYDELWEAILNSDFTGALTEVADVVYYCAKLIYRACDATGIDTATAFRLAEAKYQLRGRPGNPKDDKAERAACAAVVDGK